MHFEVSLTGSFVNFSYVTTENIFITNRAAEETPSSDTMKQ